MPLRALNCSVGKAGFQAVGIGQQLPCWKVGMFLTSPDVCRWARAIGRGVPVITLKQVMNALHSSREAWGLDLRSTA